MSLIVEAHALEVRSAAVLIAAVLAVVSLTAVADHVEAVRLVADHAAVRTAVAGHAAAVHTDMADVAKSELQHPDLSIHHSLNFAH